MKTITYDDTLYQLVPKRLPSDTEMRPVIARMCRKVEGGACIMFDDFWSDLLSAAPTPPAQPAESPLEEVHQPFLCLSPVCGPTCCECNCAISPQDQLKYAKRYAFLRNRDLDSINSGGVFAGMTPSNIVLNGDDLDAEIDGSIESANNITAPTRSESMIHAVNHVVEPREDGA